MTAIYARNQLHWTAGLRGASTPATLHSDRPELTAATSSPNEWPCSYHYAALAPQDTTQELKISLSVVNVVLDEEKFPDGFYIEGDASAAMSSSSVPIGVDAGDGGSAQAGSKRAREEGQGMGDSDAKRAHMDGGDCITLD